MFSSDNLKLHTGIITPPATATLGTRLRLRVAADFANGTIPTPCSTPQYSQTEDYSVTLAANVSAPAAAFTTNGTTTCTGCVQFTDASQNLPTSWLWTFGDGTTSTAQSPNHCYTTAGTYAVTLQATNAAGTNTSAATSIVYNGAVPLTASCTPQTINYFANYGITRFRLNTIDNTSADGSAGYQDFTCTQRTELIVGVNYPMTITTGGVNRHDIWVYLDKNNDGVLTAAELIYQGLNAPSPGATVTLTLPANTVLNQPLRLRVMADAVGNNLGPCSSPVSGQAEDYTVLARPNTLPPIINFSSSYVPGGCVNPVQFTDMSTNLPTSWLWDFGDGSTSTAQNPSHQYTASGNYNVSLSATNANGTASITRLNAVTILIPCLSYCPSNGTGGTGPNGTHSTAPSS
ncbi:PKD domain-containing protein [Hymenobacter humi]|uniref:PKD domain-containing protein n=1 Tax=Hymenobacter humi TaxID=1411620 RepID=A0ABW2U8P0_9BACT